MTPHRCAPLGKAKEQLKERKKITLEMLPEIDGVNEWMSCCYPSHGPKMDTRSRLTGYDDGDSDTDIKLGPQ